jgi:arginine deiminase
LHKFVEEAKVRKNHRRAVYNYLCTLIKNRHRVLIRKLIEGVTYHNIDLHRQGFVADPLDNIYFQRDTYSSIGNTVSIHRMKYHIRQRESLLSEFLFKFHPRFKRIKKVYSRNEKLAIEGGDIFPYNQQTLVVGVSERTSLNAILKLANNLKKSRSPYQQIVAINVPKAGRLMHLDTWLTMVDYDKFIYSPNAVKNFKF